MEQIAPSLPTPGPPDAVRIRLDGPSRFALLDHIDGARVQGRRSRSQLDSLAQLAEDALVWAHTTASGQRYHTAWFVAYRRLRTFVENSDLEML